MQYKKLLCLSALLITTSSFAYTNNLALPAPQLHAQAREQYCNVAQYCQLTGSHDAAITNDTDSPVIARVMYVLRADNNDNNTVNKFVTIQPHSVFTEHFENKVIAKFNIAYKHSLEANTIVMLDKTYNSGGTAAVFVR